MGNIGEEKKHLLIGKARDQGSGFFLAFFRIRLVSTRKVQIHSDSFFKGPALPLLLGSGSCPWAADRRWFTGVNRGTIDHSRMSISPLDSLMLLARDLGDKALQFELGQFLFLHACSPYVL